jgi:hypothetical protein
MKTKLSIISVSVILITLLSGFTFFTNINSDDLPKGWFKAGDEPTKYEMGIEKGIGQDGKTAAFIKSIDTKISGFGTLMQTCSPEKYLGKRIRMSGFMKSKDVAEWAGFWLRVDKSGSQEPLAFDNMQNRSIKATTDWKKYEIVLDIPSNASLFAYGALLSGTGQVWFDNIKFEVVEKNVPTTGFGDEGTLKKESINLDFEEK